MYHQHFLASSVPSVEVITINTKVSKDPSLRESNEGQHWLSLCGQKKVDSTAVLPQILAMPWQPSILSENGIRLSHVQELAFAQAKALLELQEINFTRFDAYLAVFALPTDLSNKKSKSAWLTNSKPVVERIMNHIDSLRSLDWQRDPHRYPSVLPDTFRLKLWLLPYPYLTTSPNKISTFVADLLKMLRGIMDLGLSHHEKLKDLQDAALRCNRDHRILLALDIGDINAVREDVAELALRVELADSLLHDIEGKKTQVKFKELISLKQLVAHWKASALESVRTRGWRLEERLAT